MAEYAPDQVRHILMIYPLFKKIFSKLMTFRLGQSYSSGRAFGLDTFEFGRTRVCENEERKGT